MHPYIQRLCYRVATVLLFLSIVFAFTAMYAAPTQSAMAASADCPTNVIIGAVFDCALSVVGEADSYPFDASTNDQLIVRLLRTSGAFRPRLAIFDTNGNEVCGNFSFSEVLAIDCSLTSSGTFTLRVDDQTGSSTGAYKVYLQKLNDIGNAEPAAFGQIITGTLDSAIESDTFALTMQRDDQAVLRLVKTAGDYYPQLRIYDVDGNLVCGKYTFGNPVNLEPCSITATGTYAILVDNQPLSATGDYALHIQKRNLPGSTTTIQFGIPMTGSLNSIAEIDAIAFEVLQDDQLLLRLARLSGAYYPRVRVYDAAGDEACGTYTFGNPVNIAYCSITTTGQHAVFVDDQKLDITGDYRLLVQRVNQPDNATEIRFGQSLTGDIEALAMANTYVFTATNAALIKLTMTRTTGSYRPRLTVFDAGGKVICSNFSFGDQVELTNCTITSDGQYAILADDQTLDGTGKYRLALECRGQQCGPVAPLSETLYLPLIKN